MRCDLPEAGLPASSRNCSALSPATTRCTRFHASRRSSSTTAGRIMCQLPPMHCYADALQCHCACLDRSESLVPNLLTGFIHSRTIVHFTGCALGYLVTAVSAAAVQPAPQLAASANSW
jgi:hypothetical protein